MKINFDRYNLIKAMEIVIRNLNNEDQIDRWLMNGIADGDLDSTTLELSQSEIENLEYYDDNDNFKFLMKLFTKIISAANKDGGLYNTGVVSE